MTQSEFADRLVGSRFRPFGHMNPANGISFEPIVDEVTA